MDLAEGKSTKKVVDGKEVDKKAEFVEHLLEINRGPQLESELKVIKVLVLIDCTSSMNQLLLKTRSCVDKMFNEAKKVLLEMKGIKEDLILMQIAGYRNYNVEEAKLLEVSNWESKPEKLKQNFLNSLEVSGGWGNEAIEIALAHANQELENDKGIPLSMVIIIGDALPNSRDDVDTKRNHHKNSFNEAYWRKTKYREKRYFDSELKKLE